MMLVIYLLLLFISTIALLLTPLIIKQIIRGIRFQIQSMKRCKIMKEEIDRKLKELGGGDE